MHLMTSTDLTSELTDAVSKAIDPARWLNFTTLLAVSGGADSVALFRLFLAIRRQQRSEGSRLIVAHFNHGLRSDSDQDQQFVRQLAAEHGIEFHAEKAQLGREASEESLRDSRYQWLLKLAGETGARYLATGHTFDDQVETILFRIFRGTGISGLAGIPTVRVCHRTVSLLRPLLKIRRTQIEAYLAELGQSYRSDPTNVDAKYMRNFLRCQILPNLRERFGDSLDDSIARLGIQASEVEEYLNQQSAYLLASVTELPDGELVIDCTRTAAQPRLLVRQFLRQLWLRQEWSMQAMTYNWFEIVSEILVENGESRVLNLPGSVRLEKREREVRLSVVATRR